MEFDASRRLEIIQNRQDGACPGGTVYTAIMKIIQCVAQGAAVVVRVWGCLRSVAANEHYIPFELNIDNLREQADDSWVAGIGTDQGDALSFQLSQDEITQQPLKFESVSPPHRLHETKQLGM